MESVILHALFGDYSQDIYGGLVKISEARTRGEKQIQFVALDFNLVNEIINLLDNKFGFKVIKRPENCNHPGLNCECKKFIISWN